MSKYVCFDIGNVLFHCDFGPFQRMLSDELNISVEEAGAFVHRSQKLHDLGLITLKDELENHFHLRSEVKIQRLLKEWEQVISPNFKMYRLLDHLHTAGVKIALLSNIGWEHIQVVEGYWGSCGFYQAAVKHFSCAVGARKPSLLYYQSFLTAHPEFYEALYLDDLPENIQAGYWYGLIGSPFALSDLTDEALDAEIEGIMTGLSVI